MCKGPIIPIPTEIKEKKKKEEKLKVLKIFLKKFFEKDAVRHTKVCRVCCCHKCGDLKIDGWWQRLPHPQKQKIFQKIKEGSIMINGTFEICEFCVSLEKETRESKKNLYMDFEQKIYCY